MDLHFKTFGQGPPLVILHGLFGTSDNWQTIAKQWAEHFTIYLIDQRNHGRSPHMNSISYPEMAADLAAFFEIEWVHRCFLLGHSMGGKTAMQFAFDYPDQVEKLLVVDIAPKAYPAGHNEIFAALQALALDRLEDRSEAEAQLMEKLNNRAIVQFLLKNLSRSKAGGFQWKMNLPVIYRDYPNILSAVSGPAFEAPSLFIRGANSRYITEEDKPSIHELFPQAQLVSVEDAGHWVHAEQPAALVALVEQFLAD